MKLCCLILLGLLSLSMQAQDFLANGDFEEENICGEFQVNCAPEAWLTNDDVFFNYFKNTNRSYSGSHCMAIEAGHAKKPYKRTFIRSQLLCGLRAGNKYVIDLFVKSFHPVLDSIGIYFTSTDFLFNSSPLQNITPSLYLADAGFNFQKDSSWQEVRLIFTARGDESFVTLGNFSKNDVTGDTQIKLENNFFVFIDKVSLYPVSPKEHLCDDWQLTKQKIYDQDERHEFLRWKIRQAMNEAPVAVKLTPGKLQVADTLFLPDILFENAKASLLLNSYSLLDSICTKIKDKHIDSVIVIGHTDNKGSVELNEKLSAERAMSVKNYLMGKTGFSLIATYGRSSFAPVADNGTPEGRQKNRRVEIILYSRE